MSTYEERQAGADAAMVEFFNRYGMMTETEKEAVHFLLNWIRSNAHLGYRNLLSARKNGLLGRIRE